MKLFVEMIAYNAGPLIEAAIRSTYAFVDKFVVVDGSAYGPSIDGTSERAIACGSKVKVIRGTYELNGHWDEAKQRRVALGEMPKDENNWLLFQDADEVWDEENIVRLKRYLESVPPEVCYCSFRWLNFWITPHQTISGGIWDIRRPDLASRLAPINRTPPMSPRTDFNDVVFYHYGHALSKERRDFKVYEYFRRGDYNFIGSWEDFKERHDKEWYGEKSGEVKVKPFTGEHHKEVKRLSPLIWGEQL